MSEIYRGIYRRGWKGEGGGEGMSEIHRYREEEGGGMEGGGGRRREGRDREGGREIGMER